MTHRLLIVALMLSFTGGTMLTGCSAMDYFGYGSGLGGIVSLGFEVILPLLLTIVSGSLLGAATTTTTSTT